MTSAYDFTATGIDGNPVDLSTFRGDPLLIVNTASRCGFTSQYAQLQTLHQRYFDKGLRVLAFPCNDFGGQEPGSESTRGHLRGKYTIFSEKKQKRSNQSRKRVD